MNDKEFLKQLVSIIKVAPGHYRSVLGLVLAKSLQGYKSVMEELVEEPVYVADGVCVTDYDILVELGVATFVCYKGNNSCYGALPIMQTVLTNLRRIELGKEPL